MTAIELADAEDIDALATLWVGLVRSQRQHGAHLEAESNEATARDVIGRYVAADDLLVAREAGQLLGFAMVHVETGMYHQDVTRGVIDNVYVRPPDRDRGLGTDLVEAAEAHLGAAGAEVVTLSVLAANADARRFYERLGYEPHRLELEKDIANDTTTNEPEES
ncbi:MAG: GNAT family N-acetyltransferase [Halobacteriaceae archaeon]